jgi:hypothetical protein
MEGVREGGKEGGRENLCNSLHTRAHTYAACMGKQYSSIRQRETDCVGD